MRSIAFILLLCALGALVTFSIRADDETKERWVEMLPPQTLLGIFFVIILAYPFLISWPKGPGGFGIVWIYTSVTGTLLTFQNLQNPKKKK
jgi:hypothetical protein